MLGLFVCESLQTRIQDLVKEKFATVAEEVVQLPILFGDYRNVLKPTVPRLYEDLGDFGFVRPLFEEILEEYCLVNKAMNLVMFKDALEHLTRVHRIMRMPQVHEIYL